MISLPSRLSAASAFKDPHPYSPRLWHKHCSSTGIVIGNSLSAESEGAPHLFLEAGKGITGEWELRNATLMFDSSLLTNPPLPRHEMAATIKQQRIVFLDLLRALAVMMMVEGHTVDVLLLNEYRSYEYSGFKLWQFTRGMTAPMFLLTAGTVFVYLLRSTALPFRNNPRVTKGAKRGLLLFALGYLLRFPSPSVIGVF